MKPLTIEELKSLEVCEWVWVEKGKERFYSQIGSCMSGNYVRNVGSVFLFMEDYGKTWLAYKNKEAAEDKEDEIRKQTAKEIAETLISVVWEEEEDEMIKVKDTRQVIKDIANSKYGAEVK